MTGRSRWVRLAACAALVTGCGESTTEPAPELTVSPDPVLLTEAEPTASLFLASGGRQAGQWQISQSPDWTTITPSSGTLTGEIVEVQVTADIAVLTDPVTLGSIQVVSDAGAGQVAVSASLDFTPRLEVSSSNVSIGSTETEASLRITNTGRSRITWSLSSDESWLTLSPSGGALDIPGSHVDVTLAADKDPLPVGSAQATLTLTTDGEPASITIPVDVAVPADPEITLSRSQLKYPGGVDARDVEISNTGKGDLVWSIATIPAWLSVQPASGTIPAGSSATATVSVDRASVPGASATGEIAFDANVTDAPTLPVIVSDALGPELGLVVLEHRVADAEYDLANDRIVTISNDPAYLHVLDVDFGTVDSVALPTTATAVAVEPAGGFAAVGHNAFVTLVDLTTLTIVDTYSVSTDVIDLVLPGNGWIHAFPRVDQWETIRSLEIATGQETLGSGTIRAGTLVRLHSSGEYVYGADNGLSPNDIEKYDIRGGPAAYMYDSPYHGDFSFAGNLWIAEDGLRIFARSGNVFRSSTIQADDMVFAGTLAGSGSLRWAVSSTLNERIYVLRESPGTELQVYETGFLGSQGTTALEAFDAPTGPVDALGHFAFVHSDGSRVYVLAQADPAGGLAQDWGLMVLDASILP